MNKTYIIAAVIIFVYGAVMPLICLSADTKTSQSGENSQNTYDDIADKTKQVRVLDKNSGNVTEIDLDEYLFGVVAAEMPASYNEEALKAQAIASYTYMLFRANERSGERYDVVDDSSTDQAFITRKEAREKWGDSYDKYANKIDAVIKAVSGYVMVDEKDMPILAAYHNISAGRTESAKTVWGSEYSYLQPVDSLGDLTAKQYLSEASLTPEEIAQKLTLPENDGSPSLWIGEIKTSDSGTVTEISFCEKTFTGGEIRSLLGLRSSVFTVNFDEGKFNFRVQGHGHNVGMSQYGANYLAEQGYTYIEILSWYYTGCKMKRL